MEENKLNGAEAVFGFASWLTTRKEKVTLSSSDNAAIAAELADEFCQVNNLYPLRDNWTDYLISPNSLPSPPTTKS